MEANGADWASGRIAAVGAPSSRGGRCKRLPRHARGDRDPQARQAADSAVTGLAHSTLRPHMICRDTEARPELTGDLQQGKVRPSTELRHFITHHDPDHRVRARANCPGCHQVYDGAIETIEFRSRLSREESVS